MTANEIIDYMKSGYFFIVKNDKICMLHNYETEHTIHELGYNQFLSLYKKIS